MDRKSLIFIVLAIGILVGTLIPSCLMRTLDDLQPCLSLEYGGICRLNQSSAYYVMPWDSFYGTRMCAVTVVIRNTDPSSTAKFVIFIDRAADTYSLPPDQPSVTVNISLAPTDSFQITDIWDFGRIAFQAFTNDPSCGQKYPLSSFDTD